MLPLFVSRIICISAQFSASFNSHFLRSSFSLILTHFRHFCNFSSFCLETLTDTLTWQPALKDIFDIEIYNYLICDLRRGLKLLDIVKMRRKVDVSRRNVNEGFGDISQIAGPSCLCCGIEIMSNTVKLDNMSMTSLDAELLMLHRHHFISNYWKILNIKWKIVHNIKQNGIFFIQWTA